MNLIFFLRNRRYLLKHNKYLFFHPSHRRSEGIFTSAHRGFSAPNTHASISSQGGSANNTTPNAYAPMSVSICQASFAFGQAKGAGIYRSLNLPVGAAPSEPPQRKTSTCNHRKDHHYAQEKSRHHYPNDGCRVLGPSATDKSIRPHTASLHHQLGSQRADHLRRRDRRFEGDQHLIRRPRTTAAGACNEC